MSERPASPNTRWLDYSSSDQTCGQGVRKYGWSSLTTHQNHLPPYQNPKLTIRFTNQIGQPNWPIRLANQIDRPTRLTNEIDKPDWTFLIRIDKSDGPTLLTILLTNQIDQSEWRLLFTNRIDQSDRPYQIDRSEWPIRRLRTAIEVYMSLTSQKYCCSCSHVLVHRWRSTSDD